MELGDFQELVERHRNRIYTFAFYWLRNREDAEDVTQEVLIRLWKHWQRLEEERLVAWILKVTKNACVDLARKRATRGRVEDSHGDERLALVPSTAEDPERDAEASDFRRRLLAAIQTLPEPHRSIVVLREIQDLPYDQIAAIVGRPLNTVKVYLHRGRKILREQLREETAYAQAS